MLPIQLNVLGRLHSDHPFEYLSKIARIFEAGCLADGVYIMVGLPKQFLRFVYADSGKTVVEFFTGLLLEQLA